MKSPSPITAEQTAEAASARTVSSVSDVPLQSAFVAPDGDALLKRVASLAATASVDETLQSGVRLLAEIGVKAARIKLSGCGYVKEWVPSPLLSADARCASLSVHLRSIALELFFSNDLSSTTPQPDRAVDAILKACTLQVERCLRRIWKSPSEKTHATQDKHASSYGPDEMLYASPRARQLREDIERVARLPFSLLITGETGTGKTLAAREIHRLSVRARKPFMELNCNNLPEQLVEAELFGYRRGAFTGADRDHKGLFEEADGGTLFLDEIGDLPAAVQNKLLKAIEEKQIKRLGTNHFTACDVRIIAATSRNLHEMMRDGAFREDLYCRLAMLRIETPALSERREDAPAFIARFLEEAALEVSRATAQTISYRIETGALEMLAAHHWTGNIRALRNAVYELTSYVTEDEPITMERVEAQLARLTHEQMRLLADAPTKKAGGIEEGVQRATLDHALRELAEEGDIILPVEVCLLRSGETLKQWLTRIKHCGLEAVREHSGGTIKHAAERLGMSFEGAKGHFQRIRSKRSLTARTNAANRKEAKAL